MTKTYEISEDSFTDVIAKMVDLFKEKNPGIGRAKFTCHDGSTVDLKISNKPPKTKNPAGAKS
jgi:hypothetical protein